MQHFSPFIFGIEGKFLTKEEIELFKRVRPIGFIIFSRNVESLSQVCRLNEDLMNLLNTDKIVLSIDQEGGRVQRIKEPLLSNYPNGKHFAEIYFRDKDAAKKAIYENFAKISNDLRKLKFNTNYVPVLDISMKQTHDVIGDRSYGETVDSVSDLGAQVISSCQNSGVVPVIKHIPSHSRATCDSHLELPRVDTELHELEGFDFAPFMRNSHAPIAMTAHVLYSKLDSSLPITLSAKAVSYIREVIGFKNILLTDDISMNALSGNIEERTEMAFNAGCNLVLHCNGKMSEMTQVSNAYKKYLSDDKLEFIQGLFGSGK